MIALCLCVCARVLAYLGQLQECSDRVPVPAVLDAILAHVPLVADHNEDEAVYGCLASMLAVGHPEALARLPQVRFIAAMNVCIR